MFCPSCEEHVSSPQPDGICLTCGDDLISSSQSNNSNQLSQPESSGTETQSDDAAATASMALLASSMENANAINPTALIPLVNQLRGGPDLGLGEGEGIEDLAGILPPEALNPQAGASKSRPVSQTALDNLKREVLTPQSAELFEAQICLFEPRSIDDLSPCKSAQGGCLTLNAVPGEFGPVSDAPIEIEHDKRQTRDKISRKAAMVVCSPLTTKGGVLSAETLSEIAFLRHHRMPFVAYVERGDGVTFVQKSVVCQRSGELKGNERRRDTSLCVGVIVGNRGAGKEVWPYVMHDSKGEAQKLGLKVPVVMIRREDGNQLVRWARKKIDKDSQCTPCHINVRSKEASSHTCPVCTDSYVPGVTIIRLPLCGHVFHEQCALAWLNKHNTCPYCRKELPTDDEDYERERRRREAMGSGGVSEDVNGHNFYG
ncbi:hypothetical protein ACHAWF_010722 [Thalassiosira exigua]